MVDDFISSDAFISGDYFQLYTKVTNYEQICPVRSQK